ncbi:MAG: hypothetical protein L3J71_07805 [Victivallaceae bacterium]|nr:hypothetical protein [Victivallaceae bacterium]
MKHLMFVMLGLIMFATGTSYAGNEKAKGTAKKVTKCSAKKKYTSAEQAKRFEKTAAKLEAAGETEAAAALKKKAAAKRMLGKALSSGDKQAIKEARAAYAQAKKEYKATDYAKEQSKKYQARRAARAAKKAAK